MDQYVVAGNPVEHSQSPFIHAQFARQTGQALHYDRLLCPLDAFASTVRRFAQGSADGPAGGCNVTTPFKFEAFTLASRTTARAALARAVNTLRFDAQGWLGDNTDGAGLVRDIEQGAGMVIAGRRILIVGAGGAAAGVLGPLLDAGPAECVVANRTAAKARELVERHLASAGATLLRAASLDACGAGFDIVINATSSSLHGAPVPVDASVLRPGALALDLMYGPSSVTFLGWARQHGATGRDGLGLLVEQAAEAFELWRGVRPDTDRVLSALRERLAGGAV
jgi:shikimate dehydrogenase